MAASDSAAPRTRSNRSPPPPFEWEVAMRGRDIHEEVKQRLAFARRRHSRRDIRGGGGARRRDFGVKRGLAFARGLHSGLGPGPVFAPDFFMPPPPMSMPMHPPPHAPPPRSLGPGRGFTSLSLSLSLSVSLPLQTPLHPKVESEPPPELGRDGGEVELGADLASLTSATAGGYRATTEGVRVRSSSSTLSSPSSSPPAAVLLSGLLPPDPGPSAPVTEGAMPRPSAEGGSPSDAATATMRFSPDSSDQISEVLSDSGWKFPPWFGCDGHGGLRHAAPPPPPELHGAGCRAQTTPALCRAYEGAPRFPWCAACSCRLLKGGCTA